MDTGVMTGSRDTTWKSYEEVAQYFLNQFADHFELGRVEGKQLVPGKSGTRWEIEAKGIKSKEQGEGFVIIECRRHTTSRLNQESMGGLAFRIHDTGASGAIVVSPLGLQYGAKKVAEYSNIRVVTLTPESTTLDYVMKFLNHIFMGKSETLTLGDGVDVQRI